MKFGGQRYKYFGHLDRAGIKDIARKPVSKQSYVFMIPHMLCQSIMLVNEYVVDSFDKNKFGFGLGLGLGYFLRLKGSLVGRRPTIVAMLKTNNR